MKEPEMKKVALWIDRVCNIVSGFEYKEDKEERKRETKKFKEFIDGNEELLKIKAEIKEFCEDFPIYK